MSATTAWLNATLTGTAGGLTLMPYAGVNNSTGPGSTGANEIVYTSGVRQTLTWAAPSSASTSNGASCSWLIPSSTASIGWTSHWSATTAGTYANDAVFGTAVSFSTAGTLTAAIGAITFTATDAT